MAVSTHENTTTLISGCTTNVTVPNTAGAYLRYYIDIVCTLLEIYDDDDDNEFFKNFWSIPNLKQLRNYSTLRGTAQEEIGPLLSFALMFSPELFIGRLMIQDNGMCGNDSNKFLDVSQVERSLMLDDTYLIGGQKYTVKTVMAFKPIWLVKFWIAPMKGIVPRFFPDEFAEKMAKIRELIPSIVSIESAIQFGVRPPESSCCAIL